MKFLGILFVAFCLAMAALFSYMSHEDAVFGIFVGFNLAFLLSTAVLSKLTENKTQTDKEFDAYRSADNLR